MTWHQIWKEAAVFLANDSRGLLCTKIHRPRHVRQGNLLSVVLRYVGFDRIDIIGSLFLWMRTGYGCQFESESDGDIQRFNVPHSGQFTSPCPRCK